MEEGPLLAAWPPLETWTLPDGYKKKGVQHFSTQPFLTEKGSRSIYFGKLSPTHVHFMSRLCPQSAQQTGMDFWPGRKPVILVRVAYFIAAVNA